MALIAVGPAKARRPRSIATKTEAHTQLAGVPVYGLIRYRILEKGRAPSRENANVCLEVDKSWTEPQMMLHKFAFK